MRLFAKYKATVGHASAPATDYPRKSCRCMTLKLLLRFSLNLRYFRDFESNNEIWSPRSMCSAKDRIDTL